MAQPRNPVLVIEDDPDVQQAIRDILEFEGFQVYTASDGKEGLDRLKEIEAPCLIILDLFMPNMDGRQFLSELRRQRVDTIFGLPVMLVSAAPPEGEAIQGVMPHVREFVKKPIELDGFLERVKQYCRCGEAA